MPVFKDLKPDQYFVVSDVGARELPLLRRTWDPSNSAFSFEHGALQLAKPDLRPMQIYFGFRNDQSVQIIRIN